MKQICKCLSKHFFFIVGVEYSQYSLFSPNRNVALKSSLRKGKEGAVSFASLDYEFNAYRGTPFCESRTAIANAFSLIIKQLWTSPLIKEDSFL